MFTGIVEEVGRVTSAPSKKLVISANKVLKGIGLGESVAVNGVCLTITNFNTDSFCVDIMPETVQRTNLGLLSTGDAVNLERPLTMEKLLGGHLVQGHVDNTGRIASVTWNDETMLIRFETPPEVISYITEKGFIAIDGVSLTVVTKDINSFQVSVVGFTQKHTTLGKRRMGDIVNLEVDIIAKYVEQLSQPRNSGITVNFLQEHGFLVD
ncbi:riboflavin synthase [Chloroflexota bacterium]